MPITKSISSLSNVKQLTGADSPQNPASLVTYTYGPAQSTLGQTVINLGFSVSTTNVANFFLWVDGKLMTLGSSNDYTFTSIQSNGTSSQITLNAALPVANLNINASYLGVLVPNAASTSILTINSQIAALQGITPTNALINGAFDIFQRQTTRSVTSGSTANINVYVADRWWCNNNSGVAATCSQTTGVVNGSRYGASVTFGASATSNALGLVQVVENLNSLPFYNQTASFGVWVKGVGNTNQVTLGIQYNASEAKVASLSSNVISSQTFTVNSSTFTFCALANVSIGTLMTTGGSLSVFIQPTGSSSGSVFASGNGFVVEQAALNLGTTCMTFARCGRSAQEELAMCQRYAMYWGSEDYTVTPANVGPSGGTTSWRFITPVPLRAVPVYTANSGTGGTVRYSSADFTLSAVAVSGQFGNTVLMSATGSGTTNGNCGLPYNFGTVLLDSDI